MAKVPPLLLPAGLDAIVPQTFLANLPLDLVREVLSLGRRVEVPGGALLKHSQTRPGLAIVVEGLVRAFLRSPRGREVTVRYARPGETLGLG
jgi:CRP/FNR family transcriptional regulator, cyclic AMP receptor protein